MSWKDISELHLASLATEDDTLFDRVMWGRIEEARWKIRQRRRASSSSLSPRGDEDDEARLAELMRAFGVERFSDMGTPVPISYLVRNVVAEAHPTAIYGARGSLKSLSAMALAIAVASPEVGRVFGYPVEKHGPVVIYDSELNAQIFNERAAKLCKGLGISRPTDLYYKGGLGLPPKQGFEDLHRFVEGLGAVLTAVDSIGFATRGDPESYSDQRDAAADYLGPLLSMGISVLVVDHKPHQSNHMIGSVNKEYFHRFIFRTEDLDGESRGKGERNIQLINEKASFAEEGHKITLLNRFSEDAITMTPQGSPDTSEVRESDAKPNVKVRRALEAEPRQTVDMLVDNTGVSLSYLRNVVLPSMRERGEVFKVGTTGRHGKAVWDLIPSDDASSSSSLHRDSENDEAPNRVVTDDGGLGNLVEGIASVRRVALDLETMPPVGWKDEVLSEYLSQLAKLKKRPKAAQRKKRLTKIKEATYKKYAVDTDVADPRVISIAFGETNVLVDVTEVDPAPLLDAIKGKVLITHNGAFDLGVLRSRYGHVHEGRILDTQLLYTLYHYAESGERTKLHNGMRKVPDPRDTRVDLGAGSKVGMTALANVAHEHLGVPMDKGSQRSDWSRPRLSQEQVEYALKDTSILLELGDVLSEKLGEVGMSDIVDLEARAFTAVVDMSLNGFPADKAMALEMAEKYKSEGEAALEAVKSLLPPSEEPWNLNAAAHIREILTTLGANLTKKTYPKTEKTGEPSTTADALRTIKRPEAAACFVEAFLKHKALEKLSRDFAGQYADLIREDGTIKGSFNTVSTGRLSCRKPNLQQVPGRGEIQGEEGMRIRSIFRPQSGDKFIVADFSQVELLIAGTIAARETGIHGHMLEVFQKGVTDIHTATAASLTGKDPGDVEKSQRSLAKAVNFGLVYGAKAPTLQEYARNNYGVDLTLAEAEAYREAFFEHYPELEAWHKLVEAECNRGKGTSTTPMGRRRKLPTWINSGDPAHTAAKNSPVQGAGADAIKLTMARLFEDRENCPGNPRLNASVHDEVALSVEADRAEEAAEWVRSHMAAAEREAVGDPESPIVVDVEVKDSWA